MRQAAGSLRQQRGQHMNSQHTAAAAAHLLGAPSTTNSNLRVSLGAPLPHVLIDALAALVYKVLAYIEFYDKHS